MKATSRCAPAHHGHDVTRRRATHNPLCHEPRRTSHHDIRDAVRALCAQFPDEYHRQVDAQRALSRSVRRCAHQGRLDGGADPAGIRRLGAGLDRGVGDHGRDQPLGRQLRRLPRPDVQHGHAAAPRLGRAEAALPAEDRQRRAAPAVDGRHRAHDRHRHHQDQDHRRAQGRPLRRQRPEGVDLAHPALGPDDPAGAHHAAGRRDEEERRHVDLHRRPARGGGTRPDGAADRQHGQPRDQRAVLREPRDPGREPDRPRRARASSTSSTA